MGRFISFLYRSSSLLYSTILASTIGLALVAVMPATVPEKTGDAILALKFRAVCVRIDTGLFASLLLSHKANPTSAFAFRATSRPGPRRQQTSRLLRQVLPLRNSAMNPAIALPETAKSLIQRKNLFLKFCRTFLSFLTLATAGKSTQIYWLRHYSAWISKTMCILSAGSCRGERTRTHAHTRATILSRANFN